MTVAATPPRHRPFPRPDRKAATRAWPWPGPETLALGAILGFAALLRLWDLSARAFHYDESLHATFTWYFASGRGFVHDPLMHGPLQFDINAAFFRILGATDFTARLPHALFGTVLVGMPYLLRRQVGTTSALIACVLLAVSPTALYYSRFDREDIYAAVWTFGVIICAWRYLDAATSPGSEKETRWLYALAALLALSFATKETTFIMAAILLVFLDVMLAADLAVSGPGDGLTTRKLLQRTILLTPAAWAIAAAWPLARRRFPGRERLPATGDLIVVIGTLVLPQLGALTQVLPLVGHATYRFEPDPLRDTRVLFLLACALYCGFVWRPKQYALIAAAFYIPYILAFTTFLTHAGGFWSGTWGSLDYWLAQQDFHRGDQPRYYYLLLLPLYEFLPLLVTLAGAFWLAVRGNALRRWLALWPLATLVALSLAGEKMPWLGLHVAVPLALAAGVVLGHVFSSVHPPGRGWLLVAGFGISAAIATLLAVEGNHPIALPSAVLAGATVMGLVPVVRRSGAAGLKAPVLAIGTACLLTLTIRASYIAAFPHGDIPVEMLEYTQTSPEVLAIVRRIEAVAERRRAGLDQPIIVDAFLDNDRPWSWYLRDYTNVTYQDYRTVEFSTAPVERFRPPPDAIVIVDVTRLGAIDTTGFERVPFKVRWWFAEENYRGLTPAQVGSVLTSPSELGRLAHFFLYRRSSRETGSVDAVALFPAAR